MGNRTTKNSSRDSFRLKTGRNHHPPSSNRRDIAMAPRSLSLDSISTAITVNSQSCLLENDRRKRGTTHHDSILLQQQSDNESTSTDEGTVIVNEDNSDLDNNQLITDNQQQEETMKGKQETTTSSSVMPERILRKLTPEEWNELVQIFSNSLEQSLKSTIPKSSHLPTTSSYHHQTVQEKEEGRGAAANHYDDEIEERKKRSATINCPVACKRQHHSRSTNHHHHQRKRRPRSLPPDTLLTSSSPFQLPPTTAHHHEGGERGGGEREGKRRRRHNDITSSHHKSHCKRKNCQCRKYITLAQLKDLGLALKTKDSNPLPIPDNHNISRDSGASFSPPNLYSLEQLCYLGPSQALVVDHDEQDSSASNMAVADYDMYNTPAVSFPPPTPITCLKVNHHLRHQHIQVVRHSTTMTSLKIEENYVLSTTEQ